MSKISTDTLKLFLGDEFSKTIKKIYWSTYQGVPKRIRWVLAPGILIFDEKDHGFNFWDIWKI